MHIIIHVIIAVNVYYWKIHILRKECQVAKNVLVWTDNNNPDVDSRKRKKNNGKYINEVTLGHPPQNKKIIVSY